jgi:hypothetical protein
MQDAAYADALRAALKSLSTPAKTLIDDSTYTGPIPNEDSMPTLTDEMKTFIVKGLACFDTPSEVADAVSAAFGVQVTRQHVHQYDPSCAQPPAERWRALHAATRKAFLADRAEIGIAQRNFRLRMLDKMAHYALQHHLRGEVAALLEQAARECGGMYDRQRYPVPSSPSSSEPE